MTAETPGCDCPDKSEVITLETRCGNSNLIEVKDGPDYVINPKVAGGMFRRTPIA
jgi:hypothetical protein